MMVSSDAATNAIFFMAFSFAALVRTGAISYDRSYETAAPDTKSAMDRIELEQQLEELHPASFAWALGCCGRDRELAEDVLQETYLKIFEGKALFGGRSTLKTWLFSVIRRTAAAQRRFRWMRDIRAFVLQPAAEESA